MTAVEMITTEMDATLKFAPRTTLKSIVVATDGSDSALAAFNAASMLAAKTKADVHVLTVLEPMPTMCPSVEGMIMSPELDRSREEAQRLIVSDQIKHYDPART